MLVAARELPDGGVHIGGLDAQGFHIPIGQRGLLHPADGRPQALARLQGQCNVFAYREFGDDAFGLTVFGAQGQPQLDGGGGRVHAHDLAAQHNLARIATVQAKQQACQLGTARAQQAAQAHHLAAADAQVDRFHMATAVQGLGLQPFRL